MIVNLSFALEAWVKELNIEATSEEEAIQKLKSMTLSEIVNDETFFASSSVKISDIALEVVEYTAVVDVTNVVYDFDKDELKPEVADYLTGILPSSFKFTLTSVDDPDYVDDKIREEIFAQTNYEALSFNYEILELK